MNLKRSLTLSRVASLALVFSTLGAVWASQPETVTKETTGEAAIVDGNRPKAEKEARDKALREAVEQVAGVMVSSDTLTANSQLVSDRIFANSAGYIKKYEVLSRREQAGVIKVTVRAQVGTADLDRDLESVRGLIKRMGNRKLVIILQEQTIDPKGIVGSSGVLTTVLTDAFKQDGWTLLDPHFAQGKLKLSGGVSLGQVEAKEIGDLAKTDYILYGNVNFRNQSAEGVFGGGGKSQSFFPVTGEYELGVFATDSGSQLTKLAGKFVTSNKDLGSGGTASLSYERTAFDISRNRGKEIVGEVRKAVVEYLRNAEQNGNRLVIQVLGMTDYASVQQFKKVVADTVTGMRDVKPGSLSNGRAQFDVLFIGTTDDLAERLGGKLFKGKKITVTGVAGNTLEVTMGK